MGDELLPGGQEDETDNDDDDNDDDDDTDSEDDENELATNTATNTKDLAMAHHGFTSSPMYHPNKKANLDTGAHPLSQIQQQFHQQFQQSMDSSKHDLMQHIQQMHHQFQSGHAAINALNYSSMFNGVALNEPAHTAAPN
ncbi:hypothetical protein BpHYR1_044542 [Brachionus plicatilis]|uniref:Uncharacterized protein n=1 Tax=Brachionus plicatilis TaxID=10195 RepID=A0A3M7R130_BRAPC|nr:hypothetical protein BpHYR1_044542 [Brachionus plicatilis]